MCIIVDFIISVSQLEKKKNSLSKTVFKKVSDCMGGNKNSGKSQYTLSLESYVDV